MHRFLASLGLFIIVCSACSKPGDGKKAVAYNVAQFQGLWLEENEAKVLRETRTISKKICDENMEMGERTETVTEINAAGEVFDFNPTRNNRPEDRVGFIRNGKFVGKDGTESTVQLELLNGKLSTKFNLGNEVVTFNFLKVTESEARAFIAAQDTCVQNAPPPPPRITPHNVNAGVLEIIGGANTKLELSPEKNFEFSCGMGILEGEKKEYSSLRANIKSETNVIGAGISIWLPIKPANGKWETEFERKHTAKEEQSVSISLPGQPEVHFLYGKCKVVVNRSRKLLETVVECQGVRQFEPNKPEVIVVVKASFACESPSFHR